MRGRVGLLAMLVLLIATDAVAQTSLTNTLATEAQISARMGVPPDSLKLFHCQGAIFDDAGDLDGDWAVPPGPSPGRITSAAWGIGCGQYLYAYQLTNSAATDDNGYLGNWDVAIAGHMSGLRIPLGAHTILPTDYDNNGSDDTSFKTSDNACSAADADGECTPFGGIFSRFTDGAGPCGRSHSDFSHIYPGEVSNDAIVSARIIDGGALGSMAEFFVQYDPLCCAHGIVFSTQVFGFVSNAPPVILHGVYLGGASSSIEIVGPGDCAVDLVTEYKQNALPWRDKPYADYPEGTTEGTYAKLACNLCAGTMVINQLSGSPTGIVNPEGVNDWFLLPPGPAMQGYQRGGGILSDAFETFAQHHGVTDFFSHSGVGPNHDVLIDRYLCEGWPVILRVKSLSEPTNIRKSHFVVATQHVVLADGTRTYEVWDPGSARTDLTASPWNNTYREARFFGKTPRRLCTPGIGQTGGSGFERLLLACNADAEILMIDPFGRRSGIASGVTYDEIPDGVSNPEGIDADDGSGTTVSSWYFEGGSPATGTYHVVVNGPSTSSYDVTIAAYDGAGGRSTADASSTGTPGCPDVWDVTYSSGSGAAVSLASGRITDFGEELIGFSQSAVFVGWTAPYAGGGQGVEYDLRYAPWPIAENNWEISPRMWSAPAPAAAGTQEGVWIGNLNPCTNYWFAIKTKDACGRWSPMSHVLAERTLCGGGGGGGEFAAIPAAERSSTPPELAIGRRATIDSLQEAVAAEMRIVDGCPEWRLYAFDTALLVPEVGSDSVGLYFQSRLQSGAWTTRRRYVPPAGTWRFGVGALRQGGRVVFVGPYSLQEAWDAVRFTDGGASRLVGVASAIHSRYGDVTRAMDAAGSYEMGLATGDTLTLAYAPSADTTTAAQDCFVLVGPARTGASTSGLRRSGVGQPRGRPIAFALRQNQPNPFENATEVMFDLPVDSQVRLEIFDAQGRMVRSLANRQYPAGFHGVVWDHRSDAGQDVGPGVYLYRIRAGRFRDQKKMVLLVN